MNTISFSDSFNKEDIRTNAATVNEVNFVLDEPITEKDEEKKEEQKKDIVIDIKEDEKQPKKGEKKESKTIVRSMLRTRTRTSIQKQTSTPLTQSPGESLEERKTSPLERKPYEIGEVGDPNLWTDEIVQNIIDFGEICTSSANKCKKSSVKHRRVGNVIQILVVLLGALAAVTSIGNADNELKVIISTVSGSMVAILTSIQSFLKFPQRSEIEANSCLELERMSRSVRIELSKSKEFRVDPYKYIIKLENQREKILRKVGIDDD